MEFFYSIAQLVAETGTVFSFLKDTEERPPFFGDTTEFSNQTSGHPKIRIRKLLFGVRTVEEVVLRGPSICPEPLLLCMSAPWIRIIFNMIFSHIGSMRNASQFCPLSPSPGPVFSGTILKEFSPFFTKRFSLQGKVNGTRKHRSKHEGKKSYKARRAEALLWPLSSAFSLKL